MQLRINFVYEIKVGMTEGVVMKRGWARIVDREREIGLRIPKYLIDG